MTQIHCMKFSKNIYICKIQNKKQPKLCCLNIYEYGAIYWSMVNLPGATPLEKTGSLSKETMDWTANSSSVRGGPTSPAFLLGRMMIGLV